MNFRYLQRDDRMVMLVTADVAAVREDSCERTPAGGGGSAGVTEANSSCWRRSTSCRSCRHLERKHGSFIFHLRLTCWFGLKIRMNIFYYWFFIKLLFKCPNSSHWKKRSLMFGHKRAADQSVKQHLTNYHLIKCLVCLVLPLMMILIIKYVWYI